MKYFMKPISTTALVVLIALSLKMESALGDESHADNTFIEGVLCASDDSHCADGNYGTLDEIVAWDNVPSILLKEVDSGQEWRLEAPNAFKVRDSTSGTNALTIEEGVDDNTLFLGQSTEVGIGTNSPGSNLHISAISPVIRLEDTGTFETWKLAAEGKFQVKHLGRRVLTFETGAPDGAVYVDSDGNTGLGTTAPSEAFHVRRHDGSTKVLIDEASSTTATRDLLALKNNGIVLFGMENTDTGDIWDFSNRTSGFAVTLRGSGGSEMLVQPDGTFRVGPGKEWRFVVQPDGNARLDGTLTEGSSREIKENIEGVSEHEVLAKLDGLPLSEWQYKEGSGSRHMGPMAEDFHATFGLGPDAKHIAPKDLAGVAMASAKALKDELEEKEKRIEELEAKASQVDELQARQKAMRAELDRLKQLVKEGR